MSKEFTFCHTEGDTFAFTLTVVKGNGEPRDLTGHTAIIYIYQSGVLIDSADLTITGLTGLVECEIIDTSAWTVGTYQYHIEDISPADDMRVLMKGTLTVQ